MAAVAVVLDRDLAPFGSHRVQRPDLRLVAATPPRIRAGSVLFVLVMAVAAVASVFFVVATGDGIPASAEFGGVAAVSQPAVPPAGAAAAVRVSGTYVVVEGDSLWSIAAALVPADAVAGFVTALEIANGGSNLIVGQVLQIPRP